MEESNLNQYTTFQFEKSSPTLSQPETMPPPHTSAPVSMPPPPAPAAVPLSPKSSSKKWPLEGNAQIQECTVVTSKFMLFSLLKDMRPHLLEVIRSADLRNCKGADELHERLKLLLQLYKQMTAEGVTITKCKNASENGAAQKTEQLPADDKEAIDLED